MKRMEMVNRIHMVKRTQVLATVPVQVFHRAQGAPVRRRQRGTASLEFIGLFPVVLAGMFVLLQLFAAVYTAHAASTAAREGAREYSLTNSSSAGREAAAASLPGAVTLVSAAPTGVHHGFRVVVRAPVFLKLGNQDFTSQVQMP